LSHDDPTTRKIRKTNKSERKSRSRNTNDKGTKSRNRKSAAKIVEEISLSANSTRSKECTKRVSEVPVVETFETYSNISEPCDETLTAPEEYPPNLVELSLNTVNFELSNIENGTGTFGMCRILIVLVLINIKFVFSSSIDFPAGCAIALQQYLRGRPGTARDG